MAKKSSKSKSATPKPAAKKTARKKSAARPAASAAKRKPAATKSVRSAKKTAKAPTTSKRTKSVKAVKRQTTSRSAAAESATTKTSKTPKKATKSAATKPAARPLVDSKPPKEAREKVSSGLNAKDIAFFKDLLMAKRRQMLGDVEGLQGEGRASSAGNLSTMPLHMADVGTDNYEQEFTLGLIESERTVLREIEEALERIENGTYGICLATGQPIGKARLKAKPWAKYSYEYTLALERGQVPRT